jgi:hypothetical protein
MFGLVVIMLAVIACTGSEEEVELTTTTSTMPEVASGTSEPEEEATTTTTSADTTTTETVAGQPVEDHRVVVRTDGPDGNLLWIVVEPGDYTSVDVENFVFGLLDSSDTAIWEIHVFDDEAALNAGRVGPDDRTADEQELVDAHYLASITEGVVLTFQGPYAEFGGAVFGS